MLRAREAATHPLDHGLHLRLVPLVVRTVARVDAHRLGGGGHRDGGDARRAPRAGERGGRGEGGGRGDEGGESHEASHGEGGDAEIEARKGARRFRLGGPRRKRSLGKAAGCVPPRPTKRY